MEKAWMDSSFREYASSSTRKRDSTFKEGEMTKEDIIQMAQKAGFVWLGEYHSNLEDFAKLVAEHERQACAKVCEEYVGYGTRSEFATTIRARGTHN
jgi:hypothetical protein